MLAANALPTFPAFIFKNALAAYNGSGSRLKVSGFRRQDADRQLVVQVREVEMGSCNEKQRVFWPETWNGGSLTRILHSHLGKSREKPYEQRGANTCECVVETTRHAGLETCEPKLGLPTAGWEACATTIGRANPKIAGSRPCGIHARRRAWARLTRRQPPHARARALPETNPGSEWP